MIKASYHQSQNSACKVNNTVPTFRHVKAPLRCNTFKKHESFSKLSSDIPHEFATQYLKGGEKGEGQQKPNKLVVC